MNASPAPVVSSARTRGAGTCSKPVACTQTQPCAPSVTTTSPPRARLQARARVRGGLDVADRDSGERLGLALVRRQHVDERERRVGELARGRGIEQRARVVRARERERRVDRLGRKLELDEQDARGAEDA